MVKEETDVEQRAYESLTHFCDSFNLRDYFAGQALAGLGSCYVHNSVSDIAETCYTVADAMLREREAN